MLIVLPFFSCVLLASSLFEIPNLSFFSHPFLDLKDSPVYTRMVIYVQFCLSARQPLRLEPFVRYEERGKGGAWRRDEDEGCKATGVRLHRIVS